MPCYWRHHRDRAPSRRRRRRAQRARCDSWGNKLMIRDPFVHRTVSINSVEGSSANSQRGTTACAPPEGRAGRHVAFRVPVSVPNAKLGGYSLARLFRLPFRLLFRLLVPTAGCHWMEVRWSPGPRIEARPVLSLIPPFLVASVNIRISRRENWAQAQSEISDTWWWAIGLYSLQYCETES